ncbi:prepilin peptidase [Actinomadura craniellae]|uniref:prepilin peptidase n=1 Tax=Actinomadura craniellae TaxID=2231787 RepID=UPI001F32401B|nr:A24 family peptidase [Actinomadura craniellae]
MAEYPPDSPTAPAGDGADDTVTGPHWFAPVARAPWPIALTALAVVALLVWRIGARPELPAYVYLGVLGVVLSAIDIPLRRLPDPLTLSSYPIALVLLAVAVPFTDDGAARYVFALAGLGALWLFFAVQWFVVPNAIGLGDVKLSGTLGLYLGWLGSSAWLLGVFGMFALGGLFSIALLVTRRADRKSAIPFGPFMVAGTLLAILVHA